MNKHIVFVICGCMFFMNGFSQTKNSKELLIEIEQNNSELMGYQLFIESQNLENKSTNNLPDPQLSGYYLPFGTNVPGAYTEYQISQSFEFPSVYAARSKWNDSKSQLLASVYSKKRQEVLLIANTILVELSFLQNKKEIEAKRRVQSKLVFDQIQALYNIEQVGVLDLNKAKIAWIQEQFVVELIENEMEILLSKLKTLNGGIAIDGISSQISLPLKVGTLESIWEEKLSSEATLQELKLNEVLSFRKVKLEKNKGLPNIAVGYNYQGEMGTNYSGFYGEISIPLWSRKHKVKAAKANYAYQQSTSKQVSTSIYAEFTETYNRYNLMLEKFNEYYSTMGNLDSEQLLFNAYILGEYSFMDYYVELQFYRNASDKLLQMEMELHLLKTQLLKHHL